ncbi:hypothetical protein LG634_03135 [Streptomyces bambusae]|uniref:Rv1733c family protein n=1 Tax=Streptomyces bambusae TaxID=1550616 RepID=UPI001CFCB4F0|nr:hypothetical protein [Streptomyces bambusae]MCB5163835.1 hypothetical protein [Streptomyces bambusae]
MDDQTTGPAGNPSRRDGPGRTRARPLGALVAACLLAAVGGITAGQATWNGGSRAAEAMARHRHTVLATTVGGTAYVAGDRPAAKAFTAARATWEHPPGRVRTETVPVPLGTRTGDTVRVWVDDQGKAAAAPPGKAEAFLKALGAGTAALAGVLLVAGALVRVAFRIAQARTARAWEAEWEAVEPLWSGRLRPDQGANDG